MARKDRTGNRKTREQRKQFKVPELGYYLIVTDTEATERCFFTGLHQALPEDVRNKLVIKVVETKTRAMIDKCLELTAYDAQYRIPWIVFDRDQVQGFDEIIKEAEDKGIQVGWSNPCFEIWLYYHLYSTLPDEGMVKEYPSMKAFVDSLIVGGFDFQKDPARIDDAIRNTETNFYRQDNGNPALFATEQFLLGKEIFRFVGSEIRKLRNKLG